MASISFTDAVGPATLTNGMPGKASRFSNWLPVPNGEPIGDSASRLSDEALMVVATSRRYGASFELRNIAMKEVASPYGRNLVNPDLTNTTAWVAGSGSPSGGSVTRLGPTSLGAGAGVLIGYRLSADGNYGGLNFIAQATAGTSRAVYDVIMGDYNGGGANRIALYNNSTSTDEFSAELNYATGALSVVINASGQHQAIARPSPIAAFPHVTVTLDGLNPAHLYNFYLGWVGQAATSGTGLYVVNPVVSPVQRNVDLAARLMAHLKGGGTCSVSTDDGQIGDGLLLPPRAGTVYPTCGLMPDTTPSLSLANPATLEYTLSLSLINLAESPSAMMCHYV